MGRAVDGVGRAMDGVGRAVDGVGRAVDDITPSFTVEWDGNFFLSDVSKEGRLCAMLEAGPDRLW